MRIDIHDFRFLYLSNRVNLSILTKLKRRQEQRRRTRSLERTRRKWMKVTSLMKQ